MTAPVTAATVYSDSARVARSLRLTLGGPTTRLRFPPLCGQVDASSLRVDVQGHGSSVEVARIEIENPLLGDLKSATDRLPIAEVQRLVDALEGIDDALARTAEEDSALRQHLDLLSRLIPQAPPLPQTGGKGAPLNPTGWTGGLAFLRGRQEALHRRSQDLKERRFELQQQRQQIEQSLRSQGGSAGLSSAHRCLQVTATLHGRGLTDAWLSYRTRGARWEPTYDIQLWPDRSRVDLSFAGQVSQSSGEDWDDVTLALSTAVPTRATQLPKLLTWKIGGEDRFIPTPNPVLTPNAPPPPRVPPLGRHSPDAQLRQRLMALVPASPSATGMSGEVAIGGPPIGSTTTVEPDRDADGIVDQVDVYDKSQEVEERSDDNARPAELRMQGGKDGRKRESPLPPPPPPPPEPLAPSPVVVSEQAARVQGTVRHERLTRTSSAVFQTEVIDGSLAKPQVPSVAIGLAPPAGYVPPAFDRRSAAARAGGYDLTYPSLYRESLGSGKGARRVALFSRSFPVQVLRKIFPALTQDAYLVAEIQNPPGSAGGQPLPGGSARLFVGADPAGQAELSLVAPGERFTLPLGIDRALKPVRNVHMSTQEKGVFSKDEITQYDVVTELANPYRSAIEVLLVDQLPLPGNKHVELSVVSLTPPPLPAEIPGKSQPAVSAYAGSPYASVIHPETGAVKWRLNIPPGGKIETRIRYTLRRPKGARLSQ